MGNTFQGCTIPYEDLRDDKAETFVYKGTEYVTRCASCKETLGKHKLRKVTTFNIKDCNITYEELCSKNTMEIEGRTVCKSCLNPAGFHLRIPKNDPPPYNPTSAKSV